MHMDPIMPYVVGIIAAILLVGMVLRRLRQPHVIAYLIAGLILGPAGLDLIEDAATVARLGEVGVVLLLFFAGMEMSLPRLLAGWRVPVVGTFLQIALSVGTSMTIAYWLGWPVGRGVLLGFVISLSSTAVIMKLLRDRGEADDPIGRDVIGVLVVQDLAIIPMLIVLGVLAGDTPSPRTIAAQAAGGALMVTLVVIIATRERVRLPFGEWLRADHELQVFAAFLLAFGLALITGLAGLSTALGAFVAGLIVGAARETEWVAESLHAFHVLLLALFFVSVGMLIDVHFLMQNAAIIGGLLVTVLILNTALGTGVLRVLGLSWPDAVYGSAMLAQIGEFSFVLASVGKQSGLISDFGYQTTIATIVCSLLVSPFWIHLGRWVHLRPSKAAP